VNASAQRPAAVPTALRALRAGLRLTAALSPEWAGRWANRIWFTSRRFAEPAREAEWLRAAQWQELPHRERPIAVYRWGQGPAVLLVHGWQGRGSQLAAFAAPLTAAGFGVVAFDAPAHGRTPGRATNLPEVSAALQAVAAAHGPVHGVIAHSFGAVCMLDALGDRLRAARVVTISAPASLEFMVRRFADMLELPEPALRVHRRLLEEQFGPDLWRRFAPTEMARRLDVPALVLHDEQDRDVPWQEGAALADAWPGARLVRTAGLGHRQILRDPAVIERVVAFMTGRDAEGRT
jgi:pimeloyl-ACP methyl ester carboxylesterase